jgi:hypothetical protein
MFIFNKIFRKHPKRKELEAAKKNLQLAGIAVFIPTFFLFILFLSKRKTKPGIIEFLGIIAFLLVFEFITLFIHPYIAEWTNEAPVLMMLILVVWQQYWYLCIIN